jgi:hypothetical protein
MTTVTEMHAAWTEAILSRPARPCALCGVPLVTAARPDDTFGPAGPDGRAHGFDRDVAHLADPAANWLGASSAYEYLARLDAALAEATRVKGTHTTWLYERTIREYSALKVRLDLGMSFHYHRLAAEADALRLPLPWHCGRPAHLRPSGWRCRECGEALAGQLAAV